MPDAAALPLQYRLLRGIVRAVVRLFFRKVAVAGTHHVPTDRGGLLGQGSILTLTSYPTRTSPVVSHLSVSSLCSNS